MLLAAEGGRNPRDRPDRRLHGGHGREVAGALCAIPSCGSRRDRQDGIAPKYGLAEQKRILAMLDEPPPDGYANWTAPLLSRALGEASQGPQRAKLDGVAREGDIHEQYIWRFLRAQKIDLSGRKSWCESNDPEFVAKVTGRHDKRRRRVELLDFMNQIVADHPDREIHVVLDHLSTHKPKRDLWLARHPNVRLHDTPTHTSWLDQIEIWFSTPSGRRMVPVAAGHHVAAHLERRGSSCPRGRSGSGSGRHIEKGGSVEQVFEGIGYRCGSVGRDPHPAATVHDRVRLSGRVHARSLRTRQRGVRTDAGKPRARAPAQDRGADRRRLANRAGGLAAPYR